MVGMLETLLYTAPALGFCSVIAAALAWQRHERLRTEKPKVQMIPYRLTVYAQLCEAAQIADAHYLTFQTEDGKELLLACSAYDLSLPDRVGYVWGMVTYENGMLTEFEPEQAKQAVQARVAHREQLPLPDGNLRSCVIFAAPDGFRHELMLKAEQYAALTDDSDGILTFAGKRFLRFDEKQYAQAAVIRKQVGYVSASKGAQPEKRRYSVTFAPQNGVPLEFEVNPEQYGALTEGDSGMLSYCNDHFFGFAKLHEAEINMLDKQFADL